jgi:Tol biopolymer transport system component
VANADGEGEPIALTSYADGQVGGVFWNRDGSDVHFYRAGELWRVKAAGGELPVAALTPETKIMDVVPSPDGRSIAFVRPAATAGESNGGSDLYVRSLELGTESRIAHDDININAISWSPDGSHIAYVGGSQIIHHDESPAYSGAKLIFTVSEFKRGQLYVVSVSGGPREL